MEPGTRWCPEEATFIKTEDTVAEDEDKDMEIVTMQQFAKAASSVINCLNFTWDCPGKNLSNRMPVLDTQLWVGYPENIENIPQFCIEDTKTQPRGMEKGIPIIQCSTWIPPNLVKDVLLDYMGELKAGG